MSFSHSTRTSTRDILMRYTYNVSMVEAADGAHEQKVHIVVKCQSDATTLLKITLLLVLLPICIVVLSIWSLIYVCCSGGGSSAVWYHVKNRELV